MHKSLFLTSVFVGDKTNGISESNELLTKKNHRICLKYGGFYGCGGRSRTYDLRVMRACFGLKKLENNGENDE